MMRLSPKRATAQAAPGVPAMAMRGFEALHGQAAADVFAHRLFAAEEMRAAGDVEHHAVRAAISPASGV